MTGMKHDAKDRGFIQVAPHARPPKTPPTAHLLILYAYLPVTHPLPSHAHPLPVTHSQVLEGHSDEVFGAAFNYEGDALLSGSKDNTVRVWAAGRAAAAWQQRGQQQQEQQDEEED